MSGYVHCACRDCFEIAIAADEDDPALCSDCEDAGCEANTETECSAPHAYCSGDDRSGNPDVIVNGKAYCPVCGQEW